MSAERRLRPALRFAAETPWIVEGEPKLANPGLTVVVAVLAAIAATHWLGSIASFGSNLLAFPVLAWLMGIKDARTILLILGTVQCYQVLAYVHRDVDWPLLGRMVFFAGLGLPIGICAFRYLPETPLLIFLGVVLLVSGLVGLRPTNPARPTRPPRVILDGILFLGGIIHGAFVCGGPALVVYAQHMAPEKNAFRATLGAFWVLVNTILIVVLFAGRDRVVPVLPILGAAIPLVLVMTYLGNLTAKRLSQNRFAKLVAALLLLAGVVTIARVVRLNLPHAG